MSEDGPLRFRKADGVGARLEVLEAGEQVGIGMGCQKHEIGSSGIPFWMFWCLHFDWKEIAAALGASFDFLCSFLEAGAHFDLGRRMEGRPAHGREKEGEPSLKPSVLDSPAQNQGKSKRHV